MNQPGNPAQRPFAAECRRLPAAAAWRWVRAGWRDYRASPGLSLTYGLIVFVLSVSVSALAWWLGGYMLLLSMLSGFVFVAPLLATGMYSVSRQIQRGEKASFGRSVRRMGQTLRDALIFSLVLLVIFLVWVRAGAMIHIFFPATADEGLAGLLPFLAIGSAVGSIFALFTFAAAAYSLPMIVDRDVDMITACVTSVNAVLRNKPAMLVWVLLIIILTGLGFATLGLGLIVSIPVLGYATWHAYQDTIDAGDWPASAGLSQPNS